ncbi:MAG: lipopolysaccharide heptosyltransferase family protein [Verrucomicrobiaceae bacterium]|nr:MAG: lipopolysaccharide heptosyltransferase family protein [Verrucomicrobiaceae bacterium]
MSHGGMLVAAPERWDEVCFLVPAMRALVASGLGTGILCPDSQRDFWETLPGLAVVSYPAKGKAKVVAGEIAGKWQASLVWEAGLAAEAFKIAAIPRRLGVNEKRLAKLLTHSLGSGPGPLEHRVRHYLSAVEELGVPTARPEFFAPAEMGVSPAPGTVLLCPGSDFGPSHEWPLERWEEIARPLMEGGQRITIASVDGGRGLGKKLVGKLDEGVEFFQASPLAGALPLLAVHSLVIAADGSLPHLAAHAGATCVTLFGPNDPAWKRPLGKRHLVVKRHVECAPCLLAKCPIDLRCQNELDTGRVKLAVLEKLGAL